MNDHARRTLHALLLAAGLALTSTPASALGGSSGEPPAPKASPAPTVESRVDLSARYSEGQEMTFSQHTVREEVMEVLGQSQKSKVDCTVVWKAKVLKTGDTGAEIGLTADDIDATLVQDTGDGAPTVSKWMSKDPMGKPGEGNLAEDTFRQLLGLQLTLSVGADGEIKAVAGNEGAQPLPSQAQQFVYQMVATDPVKARWGPVVAIKREPGTVKPGDSWKEEMIAPAGALGRSKTSRTSTLKGVHDGVATVEIAGTFEILPAKEGQPGVFKAEDASIKGECQWDAKAGHCRSLDWRQKFTLTGNAQGIDFKRTVDSQITTTAQP